MSRLRISLVIVAVSLCTLGANAQINRNQSMEIDRIVNEAMYTLDGIDYRIQNGDYDVVRVVKKKGIRFGNFNRNMRKLSKHTRSRKTNWPLDRYYPRRGTTNNVNIYLGLNNWLEDGDLPNSDRLYSLNPLTSWYLAVNFDNVSKIFGPLYIDWGLGVSMQDFSFENTRVNVSRETSGDPSAIMFSEVENITGRKSKINVNHLVGHFVPTISIGRHSSFRVGLGVYGGYRIASNTKMKFDDANGDKQKNKIKDSFHINPFKYGIRGQIGWNSFDVFFNYDMTDFFDEDVNAPRLTPVTFGVIF